MAITSRGRLQTASPEVLTVSEGNTDVDAIRKAIKEAKACSDKPTLIKAARKGSSLTSWEKRIWLKGGSQGFCQYLQVAFRGVTSFILCLSVNLVLKEALLVHLV